MRDLINHRPINIGDYVRFLITDDDVFEGELIGIDYADRSNSGEDEYTVENDKCFKVIEKSHIKEITILDGYAKNKSIIENRLASKYLHWLGNIYTRQDALIPVVSVQFEDSDGTVTIGYYSDLECSMLLRAETIENPTVESVLDSIDWGMYRENWFSCNYIYNDDEIWNLITPVDSFQCTQLGIREPFSTEVIAADKSELPEQIKPEDAVIVIIRIPLVVNNTRGKSDMLF